MLKNLIFAISVTKKIAFGTNVIVRLKKKDYICAEFITRIVSQQNN